MLSRKFQLAKAEIDQKNFEHAIDILEGIDINSISDISKALHQALSSRIPLSHKITSEQSITDYSFVNCLSDLDDQMIRPGTSIVSCCMNRNENLLKSLKSWIKLSVDEIIIVDWSSSTPVSETIKEISDPRIKILRVDGEEKWILTYGFNVGLRFTSYSKVFKLDADIEVSEDFLELNNFQYYQFVRGYWKSALDKGLDDQVYVNGSFGAFKKDLKEIGYYNEIIRTYGWDDSDLYERLASQCGLSTKFLEFKSVSHLDQDEVERTVHQEVITRNFLGIVKATEFNNQRNKFLGRTTDYWNISRLQNYSFNSISENVFNLSRISKSIDVQKYLIDDANIYASVHYLWHHKYSIISKTNKPKVISNFIFNEYSLGINFSLTESLLGENGSDYLAIFFGKEYESYEEFIQHCIKKSRDERIVVLAVSLGEKYQHKRIGEFPSFIEMISLPHEFLEQVLSYRKKNNTTSYDIKAFKYVTLEIFEEAFTANFVPKVYIDAQHGLGNRLRAIGSAAAIAKATKRELIIVWEPDHHCDCAFNSLFDYSGKVINQSFLSDANKYMDVFNYMEIEEGSCKDKLISLRSDNHVYLRSAYTFTSPLSHWEVENEFLKDLQPSAEINDLVNQFDVHDCLAAHIRMEAGPGLDHNTYDSVENWTQDGHDQLHYWRERSHYSSFIKRIDQLVTENPDLKLFIATDLPKTYDVFQSYYGDRLRYLKRDVYDRSELQLKYALADAILLSKCQKLLGSTWSSFSELAMRLSNTFTDIEMSGKEF